MQRTGGCGLPVNVRGKLIMRCVGRRAMSATEIKEIVYHCECRRFVMGAVETTCLCPECGRMHAPGDFSVAGAGA